MKTLLLLAFLVALNTLQGQAVLHSIGGGVAVALPMEGIDGTHDLGPEFIFDANLNVFGNDVLLLNLGASYTLLQGKTFLDANSEDPNDTFVLDDFNSTKVLLGVRYLNDLGFYLKPNALVAMYTYADENGSDQTWVRYGFEAGAGYMYDLSWGTIDFGLRLSFVNIFGNETSPSLSTSTIKTINIGAIILF
jgi:hypothetical protein